MAETASPSTLALKTWSLRDRLFAIAALLLLYSFCTTYHLADMPLIDPDEPRYAAAGRSMAEGGSWLVPEFNGKPRVNKPPLFYWLVALSDLAFGGASEVSSRFPSILMGLLMLGLTVWVGARVYGETTGYLAGLILSTSPLFIVISRWCITDQTLSTFLAAALACLLLGLTGRWIFPMKVWSHPLVAAGLFMCCASMTKGTGALVVLVVPILFWLLFARNNSANLRRHWGGVPLRIAILLVAFSLWWYAYLAYSLGPEELKRLYDFELKGRLMGNVHREPFFYYLYVLPCAFFPWSMGLVPALRCACHRISAALPLQASATNTSSPGEEVHPVADSYLVAWIAGVVLFYSIPGAKLGTYILPVFPAAALLTSRYLMRLTGRAEPLPKGWRWVPVGFSAVLIIGLAIFGAIGIPLPKDARTFFDDLPISKMTFGMLLGCSAGLPWILGCVTRKLWFAAIPLATFMVLLIYISLPLGMPALHKKSHQTLAQEVRPRAQEASHFFMAGSDEESLVYYLHRTIPDVPMTTGDRRVDVVKALDSGPAGSVLVFVHKKYFTIWMQDFPPPGSQILARGNHIVVLWNQAP